MTRSKFLALALTLLAAPLAVAGDLEDAQALQQLGKFAEALPKYEAAVQADPANAAAALGLSQVLAGLGRYEAAGKAVDAARKANPGNAALLAAKGRACLLRVMEEEAAEEPDGDLIEGLKSDAARWASEAIKADPANIDALLLRGQLHQRDGNDDQARMFFEQAVKADPKSFDAAFALANHWYAKASADNQNTDLWAKAESGFFTCWKLDPKSAVAAANLAHCKAWQKMPPKDVSNAYLRALALAPTDEKLLKNTYRWTPAADRPATFQKLADEAPKDVTRKRYLAYALLGAKEFGKARDVLEGASKLDPKDPYVPLSEGDVVLAEGKSLDDAIDLYVEALSLFKTQGSIDNNEYVKLSGTVAFQNTNLSPDQREKLWAALTSFFPQRAEAANNAGLWFRDVGKDFK